MSLSLYLYFVIISAPLRIYYWFFCLCDIGKERRRRLIEWVDKTSFTQLNKLFEIDASERAHKVLLSDKNLFALIDNPKSFIIPVFPHLASPSSVLGKHFVLKDFPFYEVARLANF